MGKAASRQRTTTKNSDPALNALAMFDARNMLVTEVITMGWKLAIMILLPIFIGVQLDNRYGTEPSLALAAFFIAIFGASMVIYKTYNQLTTQAAIDEARRLKKRTTRRKKNV